MSKRDDLIEKIARRTASEMGHDPDEIIERGYGDHRWSGPYWKLEREWAVRHLATVDVLKEEGYAA